MLRTACVSALDRALSVRPDGVLVIGASSATEVAGAGDVSDLGDYGIPAGIPARLDSGGPPGDGGAADVGLSHALGGWLLDEAGFSGPRFDVTAGGCGSRLSQAAIDDGRWALLVMGDASGRRTEKSPGWYDCAAVPFDDTVTAALSGGDGNDLLDLDARVGEQVLAAGVPAWHAAGTVLAGLPMRPVLHYAGDPFGVFYLVASWLSRQ